MDICQLFNNIQMNKSTFMRNKTLQDFMGFLAGFFFAENCLGLQNIQEVKYFGKFKNMISHKLGLKRELPLERVIAFHYDDINSLNFFFNQWNYFKKENPPPIIHKHKNINLQKPMCYSTLISRIKGRPGMYLNSLDFHAFKYFIDGYHYYLNSWNINEPEDNLFEKFKEWIPYKFNIDPQYPWFRIIELYLGRDKTGLDNFFNLWEGYMKVQENLKTLKLKDVGTLKKIADECYEANMFESISLLTELLNLKLPPKQKVDFYFKRGRMRRHQGESAKAQADFEAAKVLVNESSELNWGPWPSLLNDELDPRRKGKFTPEPDQFKPMTIVK